MRHLSLSTERAYVGWIRRFILFHNKKHPKEMAEKEIFPISRLMQKSRHRLKQSRSAAWKITFVLFRSLRGSLFGPQKMTHETHEPTNNTKVLEVILR